MEYDVFISYSRRDTQIVDRFVRALTDAGYRIWIDRDGINSGDQFKAKIVQAIKNSAIVLFFSSANSNASDWTVKEIGYSLKKEKTIIPIRLDNSEYEDSIDFDLVNIDFIQYAPSSPASTIERLFMSLSAHGCERKTPANKENKPRQTEDPSEELYSIGIAHFDNKEYEQAVNYFELAAEQGNTRAQCHLGFCYENGYGVKQNYKRAVKWYKKAAKQGYAEAQYNLGVCYYYGKGVWIQDYYEAVRWYQEAAEQGYAYAQINLGWCYRTGEGVKKDYNETAKWFRKAAEQGNADAQYYLAECFFDGMGVTKNYTECVKWYKKAAEQGHKEALFYLGFCYDHGCGVTQNYNEAVKWYRKAAEQGYQPAIDHLKQCGY